MTSIDSRGGETDGWRPCARGSHCAARDAHGNPAYGPRPFCDPDRDNIHQCLSWLPEAYLDLYLRLGDKPRGMDRITGTRDIPVPINLGIDAAMRELVDITASWAERVVDVARLTALQDGPQQPGRYLTRIIPILTAHLDVLLGLPYAPMTRHVSLAEAAELNPGTLGVVHEDAGYAEVFIDLDGAGAGLEILTLRRRTRHLLGLTPRHQDLAVPCWACGVRTVRRFDGGAGLDDEARCTTCGEPYTYARYQELLNIAGSNETASESA